MGFCDAHELGYAWEENPMPDEWLTFPRWSQGGWQNIKIYRSIVIFEWHTTKYIARNKKHHFMQCFGGIFMERQDVK